jgi:hypothetical protein
MESVLAAGLCVCLLVAGPALAAEGLDDEEPEPAANDEIDLLPRSSEPATQSKKKALSVGFYLLGCLIVGGSLFLVLVVMWGNRTRRLARSPLPPVSKRDELWFLKPKKSPNDADAQGEPNTERDSNSGAGSE